MKISVLYLVFLLNSSFLFSQNEFTKWFTDGSLRVDYILSGNDHKTEILLQALKKEAFWGGSQLNLIDEFGYGEFICRVFPENSNQLIYSRGFSTLFQEWQTTKEAKMQEKGFFESTVIPFPKQPVRFEILRRGEKSDDSLLLSVLINPTDYFIQPSPDTHYPVEKLKISGDAAHNVDLVFVPDGYTKDQMDLFRDDVIRLTDSLFTIKPYSDYKNKFNIYAVMAPSPEEGTDIPGAGIWKSTLLNSSFYTFDSERYLTSQDYWKVRDLAALAPCDQVYVLVNTEKYGGGGIYNHYSLTSSHNRLSPNVFVHEFGHAFAGLGDEYYTSDVSYSDFYSTKTEPWEPNLTTLVDFDSKWKNLIKQGTPIPTPPTPEYINTIGVFEGGGYVAKGVYRPAYDCIMKSNKPKSFCEVCEKATEKMILFICK